MTQPIGERKRSTHPQSWTIYWEVEDADETSAMVKELGGAIVADGQDTPYGRLATVTDSTGAELRLLSLSTRTSDDRGRRGTTLSGPPVRCT